MRSLLFLFLCASPAFSQSLEICFIGNAAFQIFDETTTVFSDFPYQSGAFGYMQYSLDRVKPRGKVISLITHNHADHFDATLFKKTNWKVIGPPDAVVDLPSDRVIAIKERTEVSGIAFEAIKTPHAGIDHYSYLVTWHGKRLYFTGDTEVTGQLLAQRDLDYVFITPWLLDLVLKGEQSIDADHVILYHHTEDTKHPADCANCKMPAQGECLSSS